MSQGEQVQESGPEVFDGVHLEKTLVCMAVLLHLLLKRPEHKELQYLRDFLPQKSLDNLQHHRRLPFVSRRVGDQSEESEMVVVGAVECVVKLVDFV